MPLPPKKKRGRPKKGTKPKVHPYNPYSTTHRQQNHHRPHGSPPPMYGQYPPPPTNGMRYQTPLGIGPPHLMSTEGKHQPPHPSYCLPPLLHSGSPPQYYSEQNLPFSSTITLGSKTHSRPVDSSEGLIGNHHKKGVLVEAGAETGREIGDAENSTFTCLNGMGIWESWRNDFRSPLLAILDLFDNAIDASFELPNGRISVDTSATNNEIVMKNNSSHRICSIHEILELYKSCKDVSNIGQNGIGIKQACANLCDLSIVLTKNVDEISMGIIARFLETSQGPYLPCTTFINDCGLDILQQLHVLDWSRVFAEYGSIVDDNDEQKNNNGANSNTKNNNGSFANTDKERGIERVNRHIQDLLDNPDQYVFKVILHQVRHNRVELLNELRSALPIHYIHVPRSLRITVNHRKIHFQYWESRLVELNKFHFKIHPVILWHQNNWKTSNEGNDTRIFIGFDPYKTENRAATLCIHSRRSGRLVKKIDDARGYLQLNTGSSVFCQGLTILVDDYAGCLPLTPTKQDLAFSMEDNGVAHETNFNIWISAYVHLFYSFHFRKYGERKELLSSAIEAGGKELDMIKKEKTSEQEKKTLNEKKELNRESKAKQLLQSKDNASSGDNDTEDSGDESNNGTSCLQEGSKLNLPFLTNSLGRGEFTTLTNLTWRCWKTEKIRVNAKHNITQLQRQDTLVHLQHLNHEQYKEIMQRPKRKYTTQQPSSAQLPVLDHDHNHDSSKLTSVLSSSSNHHTESPAKQQSLTTQKIEEDQSDDTEEEDIVESGRAIALKKEHKKILHRSLTKGGKRPRLVIVLNGAKIEQKSVLYLPEDFNDAHVVEKKIEIVEGSDRNYAQQCNGEENRNHKNNSPRYRHYDNVQNRKVQENSIKNKNAIDNAVREYSNKDGWNGMTQSPNVSLANVQGETSLVQMKSAVAVATLLNNGNPNQLQRSSTKKMISRKQLNIDIRKLSAENEQLQIKNNGLETTCGQISNENALYIQTTDDLNNQILECQSTMLEQRGQMSELQSEKDMLLYENQKLRRDIDIMKSMEIDSHEEINILRRKIDNLKQLG